MLAIRVEITRYTNDSQPGWVECRFTDAWGDEVLFEEKVPVVTCEMLDATSSYPAIGVIAGRVVREWQDGNGRDVVTVHTELPWGVESKDGESEFDVLSSQLVELE